MKSKVLLTVVGLFAILLTMTVSSVPTNAELIQELGFKVSEGEYQPLTDWNYQTNRFYYSQGFVITLPFTFNFDEKDCDRCYVTGGGQLLMIPNDGSGYARPHYTVYYPELTRQIMSINAFTGYEASYNSPNGWCRWKDDGDRVIFEWSGWNMYYNYSVKNHFQIIIYSGTNKIEFSYGVMNRGSCNLAGPWTHTGGFKIGLAGAGSYMNRTNYVNVVPPDHPTLGNSDWEALYGLINPHPTIRDRRTIINNTVYDHFTEHLLITFGKGDPEIVGVIPGDHAILELGEVYGEPYHPGLYINRPAADAPEVSYKYKIGGPLPRDGSDYQYIYTAIENGDENDELVYIDPQPVNPEEEVPATVLVNSAKGIAAQQDPNDGTLDLTDTEHIMGGEYEVKAELALDENEPELWGYDRFIVALDYDLAINGLISPKTFDNNKYPFNAYNVPIRLKVTNVGLNPYYEFKVTGLVQNYDDIDVYDHFVLWEADPNPIRTAESKEIWLPNFRPTSVGRYKLTVCVEPINPDRDDNYANNCMPRSYDNDYLFEVSHTIEASAEAILAPKGNNFLNKPVDPMALFMNNGISNISDVPSTCEIFYIEDDIPAKVYDQTILITDIPEGRFNTAIALYPTFIPDRPGMYRICARVDERDDPIDGNNMVCDTFYVVEAMSGEYTIGYLNENQERNFSTFQEAADALYQIGITGPITFILTDANYTIGIMPAPLDMPALDLSAKIVGASEENSIIFKPSRERLVQRGSIEINLLSSSGIGIQFGQNAYPTNYYADVHNASFFSKREYANSVGYITFDGGPFKAIKVTMDSDGEFRAPFYMMEGSSNITLKNLVITNSDNSEVSYRASLPLTVLNQITSKFEFQEDVRGVDNEITYSAGVVLRSKVPIDPETDNNIYHLDTIPAHDIVIENCDISNFGYGVVSLGMGILYKAGVGFNKYYSYPSENNVIRNNVIHDVSRAGVFVGFEKGIKIMNNRIYNVTGNFNEASSEGSAGIMVGGDSYNSLYGYFNTEVEVMGNEISDVRGSGSVHGIRVESPQLEFPEAQGGYIYYPDGDESVHIANNIIWGIKGIGNSVFRSGIHVYSQRLDPQDMMGSLLTPQIAKYYSYNDMIVNNTIILPSDSRSDFTSAIAIQQTVGTEIYNNAIMTFASNDNPNAITTALFLETYIPKDANIKINRNAYWTPVGSDASIAYLVELDEDNSIIEVSGKYDYQNLDQWYNWTGMDINSVFGDIMSDYEFNGMPPKQTLRIATNPIPQNSLLNNRGKNFSWIPTDIDGDIRGSADQRYDIGADEFTGRMHVRDIEVTKITEPSVYKSVAGQFSDAEYVMLGHPLVEKFNVKALVRNNGSLNQSQIRIYATVYRMEPDGVWGENPVVECEQFVDLNTAETKEVNFYLEDYPGIDDVLTTYSDLVDYDYSIPYTVPEQFKDMWNNVTPLYRIIVEVEPDEENNQNRLEKICRFYLMRADMKLMISAQNTWQELVDESPVDVIAGKLNYQSIINGMRGLGWYVDFDLGRVDFDIFDRTTWEPKAVNYSMYRSIIWSDGDGEESTGMTRLQRMNMEDFLNNSPAGLEEKKNLIISSQEMLRQNPYQKFSDNVLRASNVAPGNPMGLGVSNDGNRAVGYDIDKNYVQTILATQYTGDVDPYCGVMTLVSGGEGDVQPAFYWLDHPAASSDIVGVTVNTFTRNLMYYAVDWRHWSDIERVLRGSFDFVEKKNGLVIPVELYEFDARQVGNKVHVNWATASEIETERFEIERAVRIDVGTTDFSKIAEEMAVGNTSEITQYGPVIDWNISFGTTYVYRLKMIDINGEYDYSNEREVKIGGNSELWLGMAIPNPANSEVRFEMNGIDFTNTMITVYDIDGKTVTPAYTTTGNVIELDLNAMSNGTYTLVIVSGDNSLTRQFQVVK